MKRLKIIFICTLCTLSPIRGQDTVKGPVLKLNLKECMHMASTCNRDILMKEMEVVLSEISREELNELRWPSLQISGTMEHYLKLPVLIVPGEIFGQSGENIPVEFGTAYNVQAGIQFHQVLYDYSMQSARKMASHLMSIKETELQVSRENIAEEAGRLYLYALAASEQLQVLNKLKDIIEKTVGYSQAHFQNGLISLRDLEKAKLEYQLLSSEASNAENLFRNQQSILKQILSIPDSVDMYLSDSLNQPLICFEPEYKPNRITEVLLADKRLNLAALHDRCEQRYFTPTLSAIGSYSFQAQRDKFDMFSNVGDKWFEIGMVGLQFNLPVISKYMQDSKRKKSMIQYQQAQLSMESMQAKHESNYIRLRRQYEATRQKLKVVKENQDMAMKLYMDSEKKYKEGLISLQDLQMVYATLMRAEMQVLQSQLAFRLSELGIYRPSGKLRNLTITK